MFDLRALFAEPPLKIVLHQVHPSFLCALLMCSAGIEPEPDP